MKSTQSDVQVGRPRRAGGWWSLVVTLGLAQCVSALAPVGFGQGVDFEVLDASAGEVSGAALDTYLATRGIVLTNVTAGTRMLVNDDQRIYGGGAVTASSGHNVYLQAGSAGPVSYTLKFIVPASNVSFDRVALKAGPSGITHPSWTATAYDAADVRLGSVGESFIASLSNVPPAAFRLPFSNIRYLKVDSDAQQLAAFSSVVMDDLSFTLSSLLELRLAGQLTIHGLAGSPYCIQWVSALGDPNAWVALTNVALPSSPFVFSDTLSPLGAQRFYRAVSLVAPTGFVWIPPGTFTMGSPDTERDRWNVEGPQTQVTITRGFWMGRCEVTQREYQLVTGSNPSYFKNIYNSPYRPVEQVSWHDATNYCGRLTQQELAAGRLPNGYAYRLPTEAEWEYAARAGTTTRFSYGDDLFYGDLVYYAWYSDNAVQQPHQVGTKRPNPWGLYDMHGNIWELCSDWAGGTYWGVPLTDPQGPTWGMYRTLRGGGWTLGARYCRSAWRGEGCDPRGKYREVGFRVVLAPGQP